jgi:hypothetical protein
MLIPELGQKAANAKFLYEIAKKKGTTGLFPQQFNNKEE